MVILFLLLFHGIGYHVDKPLLYHARKLAREAGDEIREVPYGNFPPNIKGNEELMRQAFESAIAQSRDMLKDVKWDEYEEILFISKSIGTIIASAYAKAKELDVKHVL